VAREMDTPRGDSDRQGESENAPSIVPDDRNVRPGRSRTRSAPSTRRFRNVGLVRQVLRSEDRLLERPQEGGPEERTIPPVEEQAESQPSDADGARSRRERRDQRALAGWLAGRMRSAARTRRRGSPESQRER
jgi:hypothetical protein